MLRSILTALLMFGLVIVMLGEENKKVKSPAQIMESVVIVNTSSGVVVKSDSDKSLVLTAYHVIQDSIEKEPDGDIYVMFLYVINGVPFLDKYRVENLIFDELNDLALLEIHPGRILFHSDIASANNDPELGDDIFIGANPNYRYRSLKKGIISSKVRYRGSVLTWEVSAGVVFGSSGGGAFTMDGKVFGVVRSVEPLKTDCWEEEDEKGETHEECSFIPIYYMGYISTPQEIRSFILSGKYSKDFSYLR